MVIRIHIKVPYTRIHFWYSKLNVWGKLYAKKYRQFFYFALFS